MVATSLGGLGGGFIGTAAVEIVADLTPLEQGASKARDVTDKAAREAGAAAERAARDAVQKQQQALADLDRDIQRFALGAAAAFAGTIALSTKAFIDFESSFAGVRKTIDGTDAELNAIAASFRGMAKEMPVSVNELNRIGEAAGQLNIRKEAIIGFTRTVAMLGETTNLTSEQAANAMARIANIMQTPQDQFDRMASTIVALGNAGASTESEIVNMALRIAGAGEQVGLTEAQVLSFASALSSVGIEAEAGGSAFSRVIAEMASAVADGGEELEQFAQVAGMSAEQFATAFRDDAASAIIAFVDGLARIAANGGNVFAVLEQMELGEIRVRDALLRMAGAGDLMNETLLLGEQAWRDNNALQEEFARRAETSAAKIEVAKNQVQDAAISLGETFAPAAVAAAQAVGGVANAWSALPEDVQVGVLALGGAVVISGVLVGKTIDLINVVQRLRQQQEIGAAAALKWRAGIAAGVGVIGLIVVGVDSLTKALAGRSVFDILFGKRDLEGERAERVAQQVERINNALKDFATEAAQSEFRFRDIQRAITDLFNAIERAESDSILLSTFIDPEALRAVQDGTADLQQLTDVLNSMAEMQGHWHKGASQLGEAWAQAESAIAGMAQAARDSNVPLAELISMANQLPPVLREIFITESGISDRMTAFFDSVNEGFELNSRMARQWESDFGSSISSVKISGSDLVSYFSSSFGPALNLVFSGLSEEAQKELQNLGSEFPDLQMSADELYEYLKTKSPEAAEGFRDLREKAEEYLDGLKTAFGALLPEMDETHEKWVERLQKTADAHANFKTNLSTIYGELKSAGVAMPEEIIAALAEKGPLYVQHFAQYFHDDPDAALQALKLFAPIVTGETVDAIIAEIIGAAPNMDIALDLFLGGPMRRSTEEANKEALKAKVVGETIVTEVQNGLVSLPSVLSTEFTATIQKAITDGETTAAKANSIGVALAYGIVSGIDSSAAEVSAAVRRAINAGLVDAETAYGIDSPSKVFAERLGEPLGWGIAAGIENSSPRVLLAVEALIDETEHRLQRWKDLLLRNLAEGRVMSADEMRDMFIDLTRIVETHDWEPAIESTVLSMLNDFAVALATNQGIANDAVINLINILMSTVSAGAAAAGAAAGAAFVSAFNAAIAVIGPGGVVLPPGVATPPEPPMAPGYTGARPGNVYPDPTQVQGFDPRNNTLPAVPGYDWVFTPGKGWELKPTSLGTEGLDAFRANGGYEPGFVHPFYTFNPTTRKYEFTPPPLPALPGQEGFVYDTTGNRFVPVSSVGFASGGDVEWVYDPETNQWVLKVLDELADGRALGGPVMPGTPYVVGELGPELFIPDMPGTILSARDLSRLAESGGGNKYEFNPTIIIEGNADAAVLRETLDSWWEQTKAYELGAGASEWGVPA